MGEKPDSAFERHTNFPEITRCHRLVYLSQMTGVINHGHAGTCCGMAAYWQGVPVASRGSTIRFAPEMDFQKC